MRKLHFIFFLLSILFFSGIQATSVPIHSQPVIIDTDCAPDDLRALSLLLASGELDILAITSEDGTIEPEKGYDKINGLLRDFGHEGIPTARGIVNKNEYPEWKSFAEKIEWGKEYSSIESEDIKELLVKLIEKENDPVSIICMGPLTNIANAILMKPEIKDEIGEIIWFDMFKPENKWSNYSMDKLSADYILKTRIPLFRVIEGDKPISFDRKFLEKIGKITSPYAQKIYKTHSTKAVLERMKNNHLKLWDDLSAMFLLNPELFHIDNTNPDTVGNLVRAKDPELLKSEILSHLKLSAAAENVNLKEFPTDTSFYKKDVREIATAAIKKHGIKEWRASVLTNEIHQHLGIYSIIGSKMGIRALEYFHAHPGQLEISSQAGSQPPLSCLNDGLQTASGSTFGMGLISTTSKEKYPGATIEYKNQTINIRLKSIYYSKIQGDIQLAKQAGDIESPEYWEVIRKKALKYWKEWDRKEIFIIDSLVE
jgi:pyrimidine-specific ribonucleoside hydrolase